VEAKSKVLNQKPLAASEESERSFRLPRGLKIRPPISSQKTGRHGSDSDSDVVSPSVGMDSNWRAFDKRIDDLLNASDEEFAAKLEESKKQRESQLLEARNRGEDTAPSKKPPGWGKPPKA